MSDFGLTSKGFKRKQYADILEDLELKAKELFGENINLSERSFFGLLIRLFAWALSIIWMLVEKVYNSAFVDTAEGRALDSVAKYISISRRPAQPAVGEIEISGDPGTVIPAGFLVATSDDVTFQTTKEVTIGADGKVTVPIRALEAGKSGNVPAGTITEVVTPLAGVSSVTNPSETKDGREEETDEEFRARYTISTSAAGASTVDSIRASLLQTPGVRAANVIENDKMEPDAEGRPPKSIHCYVLGGDPKNIAQTIWRTKAGGIQPYGDQMAIAIDASGREREVWFSYAVVVPIHIRLTIKRNVKYPLDGDARLKSALVQYIGGEDADGSLYNGLGMDQDVIYTWLIKTAYSVEGIDDLDLEVSTDGMNWARSNIPIGANQVAETSHDKVVITYA